MSARNLCSQRPTKELVALIKRLQAVTMSDSYIKQSYSNLFKGLGTLGEEYTINLKHAAVPYALHITHRVSIPLHKKVEELLRMQTTGIISPIDDPSPVLECQNHLAQ